MVYVKYNQALKRRYNLRDEIDPISLNDIDESNEWLVGELDEGDDDAGAGDELVFGGDDTLTWETVYMASGIGDPRTYTRRQSRKRKEPSSGAAASRASKKGKQVVVADEEPEFEEQEDSSEEEEEIQFDDSESEGEEVEGYASLEKNDNDDYIGDDDED